MYDKCTLDKGLPTLRICTPYAYTYVCNYAVHSCPYVENIKYYFPNLSFYVPIYNIRGHIDVLCVAYVCTLLQNIEIKVTFLD